MALLLECSAGFDRTVVVFYGSVDIASHIRLIMNISYEVVIHKTFSSVTGKRMMM